MLGDWEEGRRGAEDQEVEKKKKKLRPKFPAAETGFSRADSGEGCGSNMGNGVCSRRQRRIFQCLLLVTVVCGTMYAGMISYEMHKQLKRTETMALKYQQHQEALSAQLQGKHGDGVMIEGLVRLQRRWRRWAWERTSRRTPPRKPRFCCCRAHSQWLHLLKVYFMTH